MLAALSVEVCAAHIVCCLQYCTSVDMHLIPEYITTTVAKTYSVQEQQVLLLAWAARFKAFCTGLPELTRAAIQTGTNNIFTAGRQQQITRGEQAQGAQHMQQDTLLPCTLCPAILIITRLLYNIQCSFWSWGRACLHCMPVLPDSLRGRQQDQSKHAQVHQQQQQQNHGGC